MKRLTLAIPFLVGSGMGLTPLPALAAEGQVVEPASPAPEEKVLLYPLRDVLDAAALDRFQKEIKDWVRREPNVRWIVLSLESPGTTNGVLGPAADAAKFIAGLKGVRVIVRLGRDKVAGNASALLALAADDLVMAPGSKMGFFDNNAAGAPVEIPDAEKSDAAEAIRLFKEFATRRNSRPIGKSHLAAAMVSKFHPTIFKTHFERVVKDNKEREFRFMTQEEVTNLDAVEKQQYRPGDVPVVPAGERLALDREKAVEYGFAQAVGSDGIDEVLLKLKVPVGPENIIDHETGGPMKAMSPGAQTVADFLNHPVVRFLLILMGTIGLLLEIKMPGTMIPSVGGLVAFGIFFIAGFFPARGLSVPTTNVWEVMLFVVGLGLMSIELLLMPGVLIFGLFGAAACLTSLVLAMVPPSNVTAENAMNYKEALTVLISSAFTSAMLFFVLLRFLPRVRFLDGIVIHSAIEGTPTADSAIEAQTRSAGLLGKVGLTLTPLRPAGTIDVAGERVDVVAEGDFVERGEKVEIMESDGTRTVVRRVEKGRVQGA